MFSKSAVTAYTFTHVRLLEAESIYILREVAAEFENPVLLYSAGKDSSVLVHLTRKAFYPGRFPFPLLHVDTTMKFKEMYDFRDSVARTVGAKLDVYVHRESISRGMNPFDFGTQKCCAVLKTQAPLNTFQEGGYDAAIGGATREEEKSRAKERAFSFGYVFSTKKVGASSDKRSEGRAW